MNDNYNCRQTLLPIGLNYTEEQIKIKSAEKRFDILRDASVKYISTVRDYDNFVRKWRDKCKGYKVKFGTSYNSIKGSRQSPFYNRI